MTAVSVRLARPADAPDIVSLMRSGFAPKIRSLTPYGCMGAHRYVSAHAARSARWSDTEYAVARRGGRTVAATELRLVDGGVAVNYIAVAPDARDEGVGSHLLAESLRLVAGHRDVGRTLFLDVFADNHRAIGWYRRLGLRRSGAFGWYNLGPACAGSSGVEAPGISEFTVSGLAQAEAVHAMFGFSEFTAEQGTERYTVGRLGRRWYRLTDSRGATSEPLRRFLAEMDRSRRILLIARSPVPRNTWPVILRGWRMEAPLDRVTRELRNDTAVARRS